LKKLQFDLTFRQSHAACRIISRSKGIVETYYDFVRRVEQAIPVGIEIGIDKILENPYQCTMF